MNLSKESINAIAQILTGDNNKSPYMSGPKLVSFFNAFGFSDIYGPGFGTRIVYTRDNLITINNKPLLKEVILKIIDKRRFIETDFEVNNVINYLNRFLELDGYKIILKNNISEIVQVIADSSEMEIMTEKIIGKYEKNLEKAIDRFNLNDYDGTITSSRTSVEDALIEIFKKIKGYEIENDGDLINLNKNVIAILNLDPSRKDLNNCLKQVLTGLISIITGFAGLRNKIGDAHSTKYNAERHHAKLILNVAKTYINFLFDTYNFQLKKGLITKKEIINTTILHHD